MIGARISIFIPVFILLAVVGMMLISTVCFSQILPTNWEIKYVNLKDDLRALAIDPLDPQVIYIGTNVAVVKSSDQGDSWITGQSFRNNKVPISAADTPEAQKILLMIEETGGESAQVENRSAGGMSIEKQLLRDSEQELSEARNELDEKSELVESALAEEEDLETRLTEAKEEASLAEKALKEAEDALAGWEPDTLTASDVEALAYDSEDYMAESDYEKLKTWLSERGLLVPSDPHEGQDLLTAYLADHIAEGNVLNDAVAEAKNELDKTEKDAGELEEKVASAVLAAKDAQEEQDSAENKLQDIEERYDNLSTAAGGNKGAGGISEGEEYLIMPDAQGVTYVEVDPSDSDKIFLATFKGIYKSEDKGMTWNNVYTGINPAQSAGLSLAIDPSNPDTVFAGTLSGIAHSADGGQTWDRPVGRISDKAISRVAIHPFDSRIIFAGAAGKGIFKSNDGGSTWKLCFSKASQDANVVLSIKFAPSQPQVIYAGTKSGVYKSFDGGESWETAVGMGLGATIEVHDLIVSPTDPEVVLLATRRGVFGTTDGGTRWQRLTFGLTFKGSNFLAFDPLNASTIWMISDNRAFIGTMPSLLDLSSGETMILVGGGEITLDGSERHDLIIESIDETGGAATIVIHSEPHSVKLKVGETVNVDLNQDGEGDLVITLDSITDGVPRFSISKPIIATAPADDEVSIEPSPDQITCLEDLDPYFQAEPTWVEVQQAAARWAEVHPDKIAAWRNGASLRAFLPEVAFEYGKRRRDREDYEDSTVYSYSTSYDHNYGSSVDEALDTGQEFVTSYTNTSTGDIFVYQQNDDYFTSEEIEGNIDEGIGSGFTQEDGVFTGHRDTDDDWWGISLSWELGDFLFNNEQLQISREARDLVELRQDVLEQATLYFFDRRTARIDMILNPPADAYSRVEMLLQIQQLDASLDAMTGGYFTNTIREREKELKR